MGYKEEVPEQTSTILKQIERQKYFYTSHLEHIMAIAINFHVQSYSCHKSNIECM